MPPGGALSQTAWIPFMVQCRLLRAIDATIGQGELHSLHDVGAFMAEHDIRKLFRFALQLGNPGWAIEGAALLWRRYHDRGDWRIERTPRSLIATLHDHPEAALSDGPQALLPEMFAQLMSEVRLLAPVVGRTA